MVDAIFVSAQTIFAKLARTKSRVTIVNGGRTITASCTKLLGMLWKKDVDELSIVKLKDLPRIITKRSVLQFIASIYDPTGDFSPAILKMKIFLQDIWKANMDWDSMVDDEKAGLWGKIIADVMDIDKISVKRYVNLDMEDECNRYELITFTDASKRAYCAAVYLKVFGYFLQIG